MGRMAKIWTPMKVLLPAVFIVAVGGVVFVGLMLTAPKPIPDETRVAPRRVRVFIASKGSRRLSATAYGTSRASEEWTAIAEVSGAGETVTVTGRSPGVTVVTATSEGRAGLVTVTVGPSGAPMAWVYADQPMSPFYTPPGTNLAGGPATIERGGTGLYFLTFDDLGLDGLGSHFIAQVNAETPAPTDPIVSCHSCAACLRGHINACHTLQVIGVDRNGGYGQYVAVPSSHIYRLPDSIPTHHIPMVEMYV